MNTNTILLYNGNLTILHIETENNKGRLLIPSFHRELDVILMLLPSWSEMNIRSKSVKHEILNLIIY